MEPNNRSRQGLSHRKAGVILRIMLAIIAAGLIITTAPAVGHAAGQLYTIDGVNVRSEANASSKICAVIEKGTAVSKKGTSGNWIRISYNDISGYIYKDLLSSKKPDASSEKEESETTKKETEPVNATDVNLRKGAGTKSKVISVLTEGDRVTVLSEKGNWTRVQTPDGQKGYVYSSYLGEKEKAEAAPEKKTAAQLREQAISYALTRVGDVYSQSRRDTRGYADCSSLVRDIYQNAAGVFIGNTTVTQTETMSSSLYKIGSIDDVTPGDLIYHLSGDNHAGIYIGNGHVLQASQTSKCVLIKSVSSDSTYWEYGCDAASFCLSQ